MVFVPQSKTDPGEGAWVFLAAGAGNRLPFCPVRALRTLRILTGGTGYVFTARKTVTGSSGPLKLKAPPQMMRGA